MTEVSLPTEQIERNEEEVYLSWRAQSEVNRRPLLHCPSLGRPGISTEERSFSAAYTGRKARKKKGKGDYTSSMPSFIGWICLILVTLHSTIVSSSGHASLRSTAVAKTPKDKETVRGLLSSFYSDDQDGGDEDELLKNKKVTWFWIRFAASNRPTNFDYLNHLIDWLMYSFTDFIYSSVLLLKLDSARESGRGGGRSRGRWDL